MDKFIKAVIELKLPTILLVVCLLWFGKDLILNSREQSFGSPGILIGGILIWIATIIVAMVIPGFKDKEKMEFIFDKQLKSIKSLGDTLEKLNKTNMLREKQNQDSLESKEFGKETETGNARYTIDDEDKTLAI